MFEIMMKIVRLFCALFFGYYLCLLSAPAPLAPLQIVSLVLTGAATIGNLFLIIIEAD